MAGLASWFWPGCGSGFRRWAEDHVLQDDGLVDNEFLGEGLLEEVGYIHDALAADEPGLGPAVDAVADAAAGKAAALAGLDRMGADFSYVHCFLLTSRRGLAGCREGLPEWPNIVSGRAARWRRVIRTAYSGVG